MNIVKLGTYLTALKVTHHDAVFDEVSHQIGRHTAARLDEKTTPYISNPKRLHLVAGMMVATQAKSMLEIGAGRGYCTIGTVLVARRLGADIKVVTVDTLAATEKQRWGLIGDDGHWREEMRSLEEAFKQFGCSDVVTVVHGLSCKKLKNVEPLHGYSLVFIDGCHSFWNVAYDLLRGFQLMSISGIVIMDDFGGSQGAGTKALVNVFCRLGLVEATVINMEPPLNGPAVEFDHCMAVVQPNDRVVRWLDTSSGAFSLGLVRKLAELEIGINWVRRFVGRAVRRIRR
jgi:predicted O-methyltransferase YrrM